MYLIGRNTAAYETEYAEPVTRLYSRALHILGNFIENNEPASVERDVVLAGLGIEAEVLAESKASVIIGKVHCVSLNGNNYFIKIR